MPPQITKTENADPFPVAANMRISSVHNQERRKQIATTEERKKLAEIIRNAAHNGERSVRCSVDHVENLQLLEAHGYAVVEKATFHLISW